MDKQPPLKLRPSDASRWTVCTASPYYLTQVADKIVEQEYDYTAEGHVAHEWAAKVLEGHARISDIPDKEMATHVDGYVKHVRKKVKKGRELLVENKVQCYHANYQKGFVDAAIVEEDGSKLWIDDFKYGAGVSVYAKGNKQLAIYARSMVEELEVFYGFTEKTLVTMTIYQPRITGEDPVRIWAVTLKELKEWTDDNITEIARDILENPADQAFEPRDDVCQFCPAAAICMERANSLTEGLEVISEPVLQDDTPFSPPTPESLSDRQVGLILENGKRIKKWIDSVEAYATEMAHAGRASYDGWKVVESRTHRKWEDEEAAKKELRGMFKVGEITKAKLVSPAAIEKLLNSRRVTKKKREAIESLIVSPTGGPTLVPENDKRPALTAGSEFEDLNEEEDLIG